VLQPVPTETPPTPAEPSEGPPGGTSLDAVAGGVSLPEHGQQSQPSLPAPTGKLAGSDTSQDNTQQALQGEQGQPSLSGLSDEHHRGASQDVHAQQAVQGEQDCCPGLSAPPGELSGDTSLNVAKQGRQGHACDLLSGDAPALAHDHAHPHSHKHSQHPAPPEHGRQNAEGTALEQGGQDAEGTALEQGGQDAEGTAECGGGKHGSAGEQQGARGSAESQAHAPHDGHQRADAATMEHQQGAGAAAARHAGPPETGTMPAAQANEVLLAALGGAAGATSTAGGAAVAAAALPPSTLPPSNHNSTAAEQQPTAAAATPAAARGSGNKHGVPQLPSMQQPSMPISRPDQLRPASASQPSFGGYKPGLSSRLLAQPPHLPTSAATALDFLVPSIVAETVPSAAKPRHHHHVQQRQSQQWQQQGGQSEDDSAEWADFHPHLTYRGFGKSSRGIAPRQQKQQHQQHQQHHHHHHHQPQQQQQPKQAFVDGPAYVAHTFLRPPPSPRAMQRVAQAIAAKMQVEQEQALLSLHTTAQLRPTLGHPSRRAQ